MEASQGKEKHSTSKKQKRLHGDDEK